MKNHVALTAEKSREDRSSTAALLTRAGALLIDAAGMLRIEAAEWRSRKSSVPRSWDGGMSEWANKCERIADTNVAAATSMSEHAKRIAKATGAA
jgi:hypothetical protein